MNLKEAIENIPLLKAAERFKAINRNVSYTKFIENNNWNQILKQLSREKLKIQQANRSKASKHSIVATSLRAYSDKFERFKSYKRRVKWLPVSLAVTKSNEITSVRYHNRILVYGQSEGNILIYEFDEEFRLKSDTPQTYFQDRVEPVVCIEMASRQITIKDEDREELFILVGYRDKIEILRGLCEADPLTRIDFDRIRYEVKIDLHCHPLTMTKDLDDFEQYALDKCAFHRNGDGSIDVHTIYTFLTPRKKEKGHAFSKCKIWNLKYLDRILKHNKFLDNENTEDLPEIWKESEEFLQKIKDFEVLKTNPVFVFQGYKDRFSAVSVRTTPKIGRTMVVAACAKLNKIFIFSKTKRNNSTTSNSALFAVEKDTDNLIKSLLTENEGIFGLKVNNYSYTSEFHERKAIDDISFPLGAATTSSDGELLVASVERQLRFYKREESIGGYYFVRKHEKHENNIRTIDVSEDNNLVVSAGNDNRIHLWKEEDEDQYIELKKMAGNFTMLVKLINDDHQLLVVTKTGGSFIYQIRELHGNRNEQILEQGEARSRKLLFGKLRLGKSDLDVLVTANLQRTSKRRLRSLGTVYMSTKGTMRSFSNLTLTDSFFNPSTVAGGSKHQLKLKLRMYLWDAKSQGYNEHYDLDIREFSEEGMGSSRHQRVLVKMSKVWPSTFIVVAAGSKIVMLSPESSITENRQKGQKQAKSRTESIMSLKNTLSVSDGSSSQPRTSDLFKSQVLKYNNNRAKIPHLQRITRLELSDDDSVMVTVDKRKLVLWQKTKEDFRAFWYHEYCRYGNLYSIKLSSDGKFMFAGIGSVVYLWIMDDNKHRYDRSEKQLRGHFGPVTSMETDSEIKMIVTGSLDCTVKVWYAKSSSKKADPSFSLAQTIELNEDPVLEVGVREITSKRYATFEIEENDSKLDETHKTLIYCFSQSGKLTVFHKVSDYFMRFYELDAERGFVFSKDMVSLARSCNQGSEILISRMFSKPDLPNSTLLMENLKGVFDTSHQYMNTKSAIFWNFLNFEKLNFLTNFLTFADI